MDSTPVRSPAMNEHRFDLLLTVVLLALGVWYGLRMLALPSSAGKVPSVVAGIMVAAALIQLVMLVVRRRPSADEALTVPAAGSAGDVVDERDDLGVSPVPVERVARAETEPEMDTYDTLIALTPERRRKFAAIVAFSILFYFGILVAGFVVTSAVLIAGILLLARERAWIAVLGGLLGGAAAYAFTVGVMNMPPLDGLLFS